MKKMVHANFFNSSGQVVQLAGPSGHTVTRFYNKRHSTKGWSGLL